MGKASGGGVGNMAQPSQRDRPRRTRNTQAVVTKRMGRKRSPAQSNQRAERKLIAPETVRASSPNAKDNLQPRCPSFPARRRQVPLAEN
jgi:hypothetical protein